MEKLYTVAEVADAWNYSRYQIAEWARNGKIEGARQIGREWRFTKDARYVEGRAPTKPAESREMSWDEVFGGQPKKTVWRAAKKKPAKI